VELSQFYWTDETVNTYFIRHTWKLNIDSATRSMLVDQGLVAIHYPDRPAGLGPEDVSSCDPEDHDRKGGNILRRFLALGRSGGYICAEYFAYPGWILGYVEPGTDVQLLHGHWHQPADRTAVLKTLKLTRVRHVEEGAAAAMLVARPRQGTFMRWPRAGRNIERLVDRWTAHPTFDDLSPDQQEVLCAEFLRTPLARSMGIPVLSHLTVPTGRTMRDIDIIGVAENGSQLVAQVTYMHPDGARDKVGAMARFLPTSSCLLFCDCEKIELRESVTLVPIRQVFECFASTPLGMIWLERSFSL
jgi:hypothetical protein